MDKDIQKAVDVGAALKALIEDLEKKYGSLTKAAVAVETSHQNLMNWRDGKQTDFLDVLERMRKALGISEAKMWRMVRGRE